MMRRLGLRLQVALLVWLAVVATTGIAGRFATRMTEAATWDLLWQESNAVSGQQIVAWQRAKQQNVTGFIQSYRPATYPDGSEWDDLTDPALWIWEVPSKTKELAADTLGSPVWRVGEDPVAASGNEGASVGGDLSALPSEPERAYFLTGLSSLDRPFLAATSLPQGNGKTLLVAELIDTSQARFRLDYQQREMWRLGLLISLVGAAVAWWLAGLISRPLERLSRSVRRFGEGDHAARSVPAGPSEVARLGEDFNRMADRVSDTLTAQRRFVADTSHELRTPIAALLASTSALELSGPHDEALDLVVPQVERLAGLTEDLLALNRFDEGAQRLDPHEVVVLDLVRHAVAEVASGRDVRVEGEEFTATLDPLRVRLVVRNLVANALQHGAEPVLVSVFPDASGAMVCVEDAGGGVPEALRHTVFDRFVRGDESRHDGGRGLGLALARETTGLHGGNLTLADGGRAFVATFAGVAPDSGRTEEDPARSSGSRGPSGSRSLVAEAVPLAALQGLVLVCSTVMISGRLYLANDSELFSRPTATWLPVFLLGWALTSLGAVALGRLGRRVDRTLGLLVTLLPIVGLWWLAHRHGEFPISDALLLGTALWLAGRLVGVVARLIRGRKGASTGSATVAG